MVSVPREKYDAQYNDDIYDPDEWFEISTKRIWLSGSQNFNGKTIIARENLAHVEFNNVEATLAEIKDHIITGGAICVARLNIDPKRGKTWRSEDNFHSSQIMGIDLDGGTSVSDLQRHEFTRDRAFLIYATPSSTPEKPRTRVLFVLDQPISDKDQYRKLVQRLIEQYKTYAAGTDVNCKDAARYFCGNHTADYVFNPDAVLSLGILESMQSSPAEYVLTGGVAAPATRTAAPAFANLSKSTQDYIRNGGKTPEGKRDDTLFSAACDIVGNGFSEVDAWVMLAEPALESGLMRDIVEAKIKSAFSKTRNPSRPIADEARFRLFTPEQVRELPPVAWLVEDTIPEHGLVMVYGHPGHGKSFIALHLALTVAQNHMVVYVAAEDAYGQPPRIHAWCERNGKSEGQIRILLDGLSMLNMEEVDALVSVIAPLKPALVVVDTLARVTSGADENAVKDMGLFIKACDAIQHIGAAVLFVHHANKLGGYRGSSALFGAVDMAFDVSKDKSKIEFKCVKAKNIAEPKMRVFRLEAAGDSAAVSTSTISDKKDDSATIKDPTALQVLIALYKASDRLTITRPMIAEQVINDGKPVSTKTVDRKLEWLELQGFVEANEDATINRSITAKGIAAAEAFLVCIDCD